MADGLMTVLGAVSLAAIILPWAALAWAWWDAKGGYRHRRQQRIFAEWDEIVRREMLEQRAVVTSAAAQAHLQRVLAAHAEQRQANDRHD